MNVVTDAAIRAGWFAHSFKPPALVGVFIAKLTCRLLPNASASLVVEEEVAGQADELEAAQAEAPEPIVEPLQLHGDVPHDDDPAQPLMWSSDFVPYKPRFDVLLQASSFSPSRRPETSWQARFHVGAWSKSLRLFGDRRWLVEPLGFRVSPPSPTLQIPLDYRLAYGGPASAMNPVGRGYGWQAEHLPNIELPNRPVQTPNDNIPPAGVGPLSAAWPARQSYLGTYDPVWLKTRWPWFPADFDYAYFNAAPADQQLEQGLHGNEELIFENLHPQVSTFRTQLPAVRVRCFVSESSADVQQLTVADLREVPLRFDTLQIDMHQRLATLLFRGHVPVRSLKMVELQSVFMLTESTAQPPLSLEACLARVQALAQDEADELATAEDLAADEAAQQQFDATMDALDDEYAVVMKEAEQQANSAVERVTAAGLNRPSGDQAVPGSLLELKSQMLDMANAMRAIQPQAALELDAQAAEMDQLAAVEADMQAEPGAELTREAVERMAAAGESFHGRSLADLELYDLDLSGLDFSSADFSECMLDGVNLAGANLHNANFSQADLTQANLSGAKADQADFTEAILEGCDFTNASLQQANLSELDLNGLSFRGVQASGADFSSAQLKAANFSGAILEQADFSGAQVDGACFERARLNAASFEGASVTGARLMQADLTDLHASEQADFSRSDFTGCTADGSIWDASRLDNSDLSQSTWRRAIFSGASLIGCRFDRSDLSDCVLDDADLSRASLDQCNLLRASLDRAQLVDASLRESNVYQAGFWGANLTGLDRRGTKLTGTVLRDE